ncbi:MAG: twin-arginine translocase subunit TatC [Desulfurococcales archaeon]|nr:twin-arginine translocase subunit TatC [Desulfurococcales archaeon]
MTGHDSKDSDIYEGPPGDEPKEIHEHFIELAERLRRALIAVVVIGAVLSFIPTDFETYVPVISWLPQTVIKHVLPQQVSWRGHTYTVKIAQYSPLGGFNVLAKTALLLGLVGASPIIAREIYGWLAPGLYPHERRLLKRLVIVGGVLFGLGVLAAFLLVLPVAFKFMIITSAVIAGQDTLVAFSDIEQLFDTIMLIAIATGIAFESPLIVYLLVRLGFLSPEAVTGENRRYVALFSYIIGAFISPDPSGLGMLIIGTIMFASIMAAARLAGRAVKEEEEAEQEAIRPAPLITPAQER